MWEEPKVLFGQLFTYICTYICRNCPRGALGSSPTTDEHRAKISEAMSAINGLAVIVTNIKTGEIEEFATLTEAGAALGVSRTTIKKTIGSGKVFRDSYIINLKN